MSLKRMDHQILYCCRQWCSGRFLFGERVSSLSLPFPPRLLYVSTNYIGFVVYKAEH